MAAEPAATLYICKKLGFDVTGIDNSPGAVRVCRERGLSKVKLRPISHIDKFSSNSFDTVLMLGNNFGLFGGLRAARRTLKSLGRITNAGAVIIAEST
ncbi:MAG TPA: class I SAM-dependent methyltransferase, partial [Blastocatellia bacterium]|nr:class I SAM-dependent methyltransferase [Blastocatellia bacterium]